MNLSGSRIKTGDWVICVDNSAGYALDLTAGKWYKVIQGEYYSKHSDLPLIKILTDKSKVFGAFASRFKLIPQMKTKLGELW